MLFTQIKRTLYIGLVSVVRNTFISFSVIFVMSVALFIIGFSFLFGRVIEDVTEELRDKVDMTVYFVQDADESQIFEFKDKLRELTAVREVLYISQSIALEEYQKRHEEDADILRGLEILEDNPFRARLSVRAHNTDDFESIARFLENEDILSVSATTIIDKIDYYQNREIIERLGSIVETVNFFSRLTISLLIFISFLLIFNIERLIIYLSREEIKVMRLIGADDWYVRAPFLVSGAIYGLIGALTAIILLYPVSYWISPSVEQFFGSNGLFVYYLSSFFSTMGVLVLIGIGVGVISSYLSTRKYLDD